MGYQLNDGTHVNANSPFADRKLSWKAAILVQRRTAGKGRLIVGYDGWKEGEGCPQTGRDFMTHPNCDHLAIIHAQRTQNGYRQKTHKKTGLTWEGRLNIAM